MYVVSRGVGVYSIRKTIFGHAKAIAVNVVDEKFRNSGTGWSFLMVDILKIRALERLTFIRVQEPFCCYCCVVDR